MADVGLMKLQLKEWESAFFKVHQRKPAKDDIQKAPDNIKGLYRSYHASRRPSGTQATPSITQSASNKADQDATAMPAASNSPVESQPTESKQMDVWGPELNKKATGPGEATGSLDAGKAKAGSTLLKNLGDKLFTRCSNTTPKFASKKRPMMLNPALQDQDSALQLCSPVVSPEPPSSKPVSASLSGCSTALKSPSSVGIKPANSQDDTRHESATVEKASKFITSSSSISSPAFRSSSSAGKKSPDVDADAEFRLQGAMFEKAVRLSSTSKRNRSFDEVGVPQKYLQSGKPKRQFSLGRAPGLGQTSVAQSQDVGYDGFGSDEVDAFGLGSQKNSASQRGFGDDAIKDSGGSERLGEDLDTFSFSAGKSFSSRPPSTGFQHSSNQVEPSCSGGNLTGKQIRSQTNPLRKPENMSDDTAEETEGNVTRGAKRNVKGKSTRSQSSHKSISDIVDSTESRENNPLSGDLYNFDGDDNDFGGTSVADTTAEGRLDGGKGKGGVKGKGKAGGVSGKRKAEAMTRPRKRNKLDDDAGDSVDLCDAAADDGMMEEDTVDPVKAPAKKIKVPKASGGGGNISTARKTDNFVRLNMKVKKFVRAGARMTGGQYKRKQWKQKMAARSKSYGENKCFKCGGSGHWANKCKEKGAGGGPSLGGDIAPVDEEGYPSLKSAALMARGVKADDTDHDPVDELAVEAMVVREKHEPKVVVTPVTPFTQLVTDVEESVQQGLETFGFSTFKPGQRETITRVLNGQSTLVILSTGGGKSLTYQLPAYLYAQHSRGITLVVSPLVSLMEDQVTGLPPGVKGACLNSNMTPAQRNGVLADVNDGNVHFLLVSPEAVVGGGGRGQGSFPSADKLPPIFFACIDEVHCLSEWSHNFRPSYLRLCKVLREKYGVTCFLGLTATATKTTATDVARHLGISDIDAATVRGSPVPPNLCLSVSRDENRDEALVNLLQGGRFSGCSSIIIYCTRRQQVEQVGTLIRTCLKISDSKTKKKKPTAKGKKPSTAFNPDDWQVESYHAGMTPAQRKRVQKNFMGGNLRVVVATVAFGMGLDKADVRGIIHYNMPKSFENYVQEIGRAGRDGKESHCHLFLDPQATVYDQVTQRLNLDLRSNDQTRLLNSFVPEYSEEEVLAMKEDE